MEITKQRFRGLTGNQLKILAMVFMTCDHVGLQLLPQWGFLRILGRLSLPIYAYMIAEGCRYTHDRRKYLLRLADLGVLCQIVYFLAAGDLYMCILITFSLSVALIWALEEARRNPCAKSIGVALGVSAGTIFLCVLLPRLLPGFCIDYGLAGVLLPVLIYFGKPKLLFLCLGLAQLALTCEPIQWWSFAAVPLLMCYSGEKGKHNIGTLFYLYYPLHLAVIYLLSLIVSL